jgi:hypothetical protein
MDKHLIMAMLFLLVGLMFLFVVVRDGRRPFYRLAWGTLSGLAFLMALWHWMRW